MNVRVVFDTNVVISALLFRAGRLAWLRAHWRDGVVVPLVSADTIAELVDALAYPKFGLTHEDIENRLSDYVPHVEVVRQRAGARLPQCRDPVDQKFIELAIAGNAGVLVSGDKDLVAMKAEVSFAIETPAEYELRFAKPVNR